MRFLAQLTETIAFIRIAASPGLIGFGLGWVIWAFYPDMAGCILGSILTIAGIGIGIFGAMRIRKKESAIDFISRVNASPELNQDKNELN